MFPQEVIRHKRDGAELTPDEIDFVVRGITDGTMTDGQVAAFAMAVFFRGMTMPERVRLTQAMARSGRVIDWSGHGFKGPVLDKHSTGGVGDKTSLMIAPIIAACGGFVPMISGRGLGHTGGTLDKMQTIPGYDVAPDITRFGRAVAQAGCAIIGQTPDLAPADRRLYAVRDTTATVESIALITASILSKKLAAGLDALVMDVKFGSGAFMAKVDDARDLARSIATVANDGGLSCSALLTDMDQVLGRTAGNALEVREAVSYLKGEMPEPRLREVATALSAELLVLGGLAADDGTARAAVERAVASGAAAERFGRMVAALGGPADLLEKTDVYLERAPVTLPVFPQRAGHIARMDCRAIGLVVMGLGGGRSRPEDRIDGAVGLDAMKVIGDLVDTREPVAIVHARTTEGAERARAELLTAIEIADTQSPAPPPVLERIGPTR